MRISNNQILLTVLENVRKPTARILERQTKLSSGKRINKHADDPLGSGQLQKYRGKMADAEQYIRNIDSGTVWMQQTESNLDRLESNLTRAKSLTVTAASDANGPEERKKIGAEIDQILEDVLATANAQDGDRYLFAGQNTTERPFVEIRGSGNKITAVTLSGDVSGSIKREISDGVYVSINTPGSSVFDLTSGPITELIALRDALENNDVTEIKNSLDTIDLLLETSLNARTELGARMNRMETAKTSLESYNVDLTNVMSNIEDTDIAEQVMRLASDQTAYQAAISAASKIMQTSLVDLLT